MANEYEKYGRKEYFDKIRYEDELKPYEDFEVLAGFDRCSDGSDEWFLVKSDDAKDYVVIVIDRHFFEANEIKLTHFDSLLPACDYIREELDYHFSLGDAETADAVFGLLDSIFGD